LNKKGKRNDEGREKPFSHRTKEKEIKRDKEIALLREKFEQEIT
jgi:hypothetical protein